MLIIAIKNSEDHEMLQRTLKSVMSLNNFALNDIKILIEKCSGDQVELAFSEDVLSVQYTDQMEDILDELLHADDFVHVVDAGDIYAPESLDDFFYRQRAETPSDLYIFREGSYGYRLNRQLDDRIDIESGTGIWTGATPMLMSAGLYRANSSTPEQSDTGLPFVKFLLAGVRITVLSGAIRTNVPHEDVLYSESKLFTSEWYLEFVRQWRTLFDRVCGPNGEVPLYLQRLYVYLLLTRLKMNSGRRDKGIIRDATFEEFYTGVRECLQYVDDSEIWTPHISPKGVPKGAYLKLLRTKYDGELRISVREDAGDILAEVGDLEIERASRIRFAIEAMDVDSGELIIAGKLQAVALWEFTNLEVTFGGHTDKLEDDGRYSEQAFFGERVLRYHTVTARLPLEVVQNAKTITFTITHVESGVCVPVDLDFRSTPSRLSGFPGSYWAVASLLLRKGERGISVALNSWRRRVKAELLFQTYLLRGNRVTRAAAALRLLYFLTRFWFNRKATWIYYDRLVRGGDNAEYAYAYASRQNDGIRKYYVLIEGAPDAKRFREEGREYLPHKSFRHRLLFLNAEIVFGTHLKPATRNAFSWNEEYFRDLFQYKLLYLNHGLVLDRLDYVLHKRADNANLMCVVSTLERENLLQPTYGYRSDEVAITGFARYDGLESRSSRQLLIAPTWRIYLNRPQRDDQLQTRSNGFADSEYFRVFNSLINNRRLIDAARLYGYKISYLLHPNTSAHLGDYKVSDDCVEVLAASDDVSYEQILNDSALMITDYSGVQFDFAYTNKPVVYYHPPSLPPHYAPGNFDFERDGFGEVTEQESELVELLIEYMRDGCTLRSRYRQRIERFFVYQDRQNSQRVYEAALRMRQRG